MTEKRQADRIKAIILFDSGFSPSQVAEVLLIDRSTVLPHPINSVFYACKALSR
jgi:hypothetical protein